MAHRVHVLKVAYPIPVLYRMSSNQVLGF